LPATGLPGTAHEPEQDVLSAEHGPIKRYRHPRRQGRGRHAGRDVAAGEHEVGLPVAARLARAARPQKIKGISIFVDCWYSG
jgi:hypothetical protein